MGSKEGEEDNTFIMPYYELHGLILVGARLLWEVVLQM